MDGVSLRIVALHKIDSDDVDSNPRSKDISSESIDFILLKLCLSRTIGENKESFDVLLSAHELINLSEREVDSREDISSWF